MSMLDTLQAGDLNAITAILDDRPRLLHTHVPYERKWGQELWLPLHQAVRLGKLEVVTLLIERGAEPDSRTRFHTPDHARATALHIAAEHGHLDIAHTLLAVGATRHVLDAYQRMPTDIAQAKGYIDLAAALQRDDHPNSFNPASN